MFENGKSFCETRGYPYKIINNHFYWQTPHETGEHYQDKNNIWRVSWHSHEFFDTLDKTTNLKKNK